MKVCINPGHDVNLDCGAVNQELNLKEADVALSIANMVIKYLNDAYVETIFSQSNDLVEISNIANENFADLFVSIHCNASTPQAHGTETFVYSFGGASETLAKCIQEQLINTLHTTDRGVKSADFSVLRRTTMPAVLVEIAFITNYDEAILLRDEQEEIAKAIARGITDSFPYIF